MNTAEPEESIREAGGGWRAKLARWLVMAAFAAALSVASYHAVCGGFWSYDDMGFFMLTQKTLAAGHPLYDETYTLYGPAYYAWQQFLHAVTRQPLTHDTTLLFTTVALVAIPLLLAGYVSRLARNLFLTVFTCFAVFDVLLVNLKSEPGHPQELCALLLGGMLLAGSFISGGRCRGLLLGVIGLLVGVLSMTKPNLGLFAAMAGALTFSRLAPPGKARLLMFGASALAAIVLPAVLMRHNLPEASAYCVLASGAVLLLVLRLGRWLPDQTLPWRALAAAVVGFGGSLLVCAVYALAGGTSLAGLVRGWLLQHVGFDQVFFVQPGFELEEALAATGLGFLVRAGVGPCRHLWGRASWVPSALELGVLPSMVLAALTLGLTHTFVWSLPLVVATVTISPRQRGLGWDFAARGFMVSLAVLMALWGYPVWGSQAGFSFFLLIPVAVLSCSDAVRSGCWGGSAGKVSVTKTGSAAWHKTAGRVLTGAAVAVVLAVALVQARRAVVAYNGLEPSELPGSRRLRMPPDEAAFYRRLIQALQAHGRTFFAMPGMGSLYFWTGQEPPTLLNATTWMMLLTPAQQSRVVMDLQQTPELCVVRWNALAEFWTRGRDLSQNQIVRYLEDNFVAVESFNGCEILVRR